MYTNSNIRHSSTPSYCHCGSAGCSWQDWRENSNECFEKCKKCDYVKCPNAFFNQTTMACECGEFGDCAIDYVHACGLV
jgi:hypothetical protein